MKTATENTVWTTLIAGGGVQTAGTATTTTYVAATAGETNVVLLNVGSATAGSVIAFEVLAGTAATPGGSTVVVGSIAASSLTAQTPGLYAVEIRSNQLTAGTVFLGARYAVPTGGSVFASVTLERTNLRNMPPTNGLAGSALYLA
jgi:hypothetical protein